MSLYLTCIDVRVWVLFQPILRMYRLFGKLVVFFIYERYGIIFLRMCVPIKPNRQNGLKGALLSSLVLDYDY
jgi:hypothetical protein